MPSFDVVSEVDKHELSNAVDQAKRELDNRFDFRGVDAGFELEDFTVILRAPSVFQVNQMLDILRGRMSARGIDVRCLDAQKPDENVSGARQQVIVRQGLDQRQAKELVAALKRAKLKVQAQIMGEQLRVTGKSRDELQSAMNLLRDTDVELPLQFQNFRD